MLLFQGKCSESSALSLLDCFFSFVFCYICFVYSHGAKHSSWFRPCGANDASEPQLRKYVRLDSVFENWKIKWADILKTIFLRSRTNLCEILKKNHMNLITNTGEPKAIFGSKKWRSSWVMTAVFHEKMKCPKLIKDHSEMIPGGSGHQKTWFWMAWSLPELRKIIKNGKLKNWKSKCFYFKESVLKAIRFHFPMHSSRF